jgi:hypothetical protein
MDLDSLTALARSLTREQFIQRAPGTFLAVLSSMDGVMMGFRTEVVRITSVPKRAAPLAIHPLVKAEGNPYPDRISVGRARNCDIVLRAPSVSKLHAHFQVRRAGIYELVDLGSHNGSRVNGQRVPPQTPELVESGDVVQFGDTAVQLVDGGGLYSLLR